MPHAHSASRREHATRRDADYVKLTLRGLTTSLADHVRSQPFVSFVRFCSNKMLFCRTEGSEHNEGRFAVPYPLQCVTMWSCEVRRLGCATVRIVGEATTEDTEFTERCSLRSFFRVFRGSTPRHSCVDSGQVSPSAKSGNARVSAFRRRTGERRRLRKHVEIC